MKKHIFLVIALLSAANLYPHNADVLIAGTLDFCDGLGKIVYGLIDHLGNRIKINYSGEHICTFYYDPYKLRNRVNKVFDYTSGNLFLYTNPMVTLLSNNCYKSVPDDVVKRLKEGDNLDDYNPYGDYSVSEIKFIGDE